MLTNTKIPETNETPTRASSDWLNRLGYWFLILLVLNLPFELTQRPFIQTELIVVSNLKLIFLIVAGLAGLTLLIPLLTLASQLSRGVLDRSNYLYKQRFSIGLFLALLVACVLSSAFSGKAGLLGEGLKWTIHLALTGLVCLSMPLWLADDTERKIRWLGRVLVLGAVIAAGVGFLEFILGRDFAESLAGWFKAKPTEAGPFLRLSGTFEYANITAMYFELSLPFAMLELVGVLSRPRFERKNRLIALLWVAVIGVLLMALLLTLSRGAWLGMAVGLAAMVIATRRLYPREQRRAWWWVFGLTAGLGAILALLSVLLLPQFALRFNSQSDQDWFKAAYSSPAPETMNICQTITVPVTVKNLSPLTWQVSHAKPFNLSYHWLAANGTMVVFEGIRTSLTQDLPPDGSLTIAAEVRAPANPGHYSLVWDMVQEDVSWFSLKSTLYTKIPVQINDLPSSQKATACDPALVDGDNGKPFPKELPKVLIQPDRQQLWKAALGMIAARPLFGVGPNAFRFSYGEFSQPRLTEWDNRIFANNLALEIFADLGLVGGLLFFAVFIVICWRLLKLAWFGRGATLWQVALIGALAAFLGHGILDYILGSNAISFLFWILLGLAATLPAQQTTVDSAS
jgi:O-antigen ligase